MCEIKSTGLMFTLEGNVVYRKAYIKAIYVTKVLEWP